MPDIWAPPGEENTKFVSHYANISSYTLGMLGALPDPDPVLAKSGKSLRALRDLLVDAHLSSVWNTRKSGVTKYQYELVPVKETELKKMQAQEIQRNSTSYVDGLVAMGNVTPSQKQDIITLHMSMDKSQKDILERCFSEMPALAELSKQETMSKADVNTSFSDLVKAYQIKNNIPTYAKAFHAFKAENPELVKKMIEEDKS